MSLELKHVTKRYPNGAIGALDVSLRIDDGEFVAFFGPSGSGKTSLLQMIGLLMPPDEGEVWIGDERVDQLSEGAGAVVRRTKLGFVFQSAGLLSLLSAQENVDVAMRLLNVSARKAKPQVKAALESVNMENRADHRPDELSGGEQQRVAIARGLVHEPGYLLCDEPTGELDTNTGAEILGLLREIAATGTTVVMATHDPAALDYVDRALFVQSGTLHLPDRAELSLWLKEGQTIQSLQ
jgi:putative ABC transport system ATP-binding protein